MVRTTPRMAMAPTIAGSAVPTRRSPAPLARSKRLDSPTFACAPGAISANDARGRPRARNGACRLRRNAMDASRLFPRAGGAGRDCVPGTGRAGGEPAPERLLRLAVPLLRAQRPPRRPHAVDHRARAAGLDVGPVRAGQRAVKAARAQARLPLGLFLARSLV